MDQLTPSPFMHILFWIALTLSPPDATQILVKGPNLTAAWTRVERGWSYSADRSIWSVEKTAVKTSASDGKTDKIDVGESVKGIQDHDWRKSATLRLEHGETLAKEGETFVFTLAAGTPDEKRFVIQHRRKSAAAPQQTASAVLEFHIVPNDSESSRRPLYPAFVDKTRESFAPAAIKELAEKGPQAARLVGSEFQWFELAFKMNESDALIGTYQGKKYALLCARTPYVMLPERDGTNAWHVEKVSVRTDEGSPDRNSIRIKLDERGGDLFAALTAANIENRLATVVDGKVINAPIIRSKISREIAISGNYSKKDATELAARLQAAMNVNKEPARP